jgi:hypothetical protein
VLRHNVAVTAMSCAIALAACSGTAKVEKATCCVESSLSITELYPYVVPNSYPDPEHLWTPVGHGVQASLVFHRGNLVRSITRRDLRALKITPDRARSIALKNLEVQFKSGEIKAQLFEHGPQGRPFIIVGDHWDAAAVILLRTLDKFAKKNLKTDAVYASIPQQGTLLLFPAGGLSYQNAMRSMIKQNETGKKPITLEFFALTKGPVIPI